MFMVDAVVVVVIIVVVVVELINFDDGHTLNIWLRADSARTHISQT